MGSYRTATVFRQTRINKGRSGVCLPSSPRRSFYLATRAALCLVAGLTALLPAAASLPDIRSTPDCDCEGAVALERQRLQAEHTRSVQALERTYQTLIEQLEALVAALGGRTNDATTRDGVPDLTHLPRAPLAPDTPTGAGGVRPTGAARGLDEQCGFAENALQCAVACVKQVPPNGMHCTPKPSVQPPTRVLCRRRWSDASGPS
jgi:hypothetical protein